MTASGDKASGLERFKPAAPKNVHLLLAALLWSVIGIYLLYRSYGALVKLDFALGAGVAVAAGVIGFVKGLKVIRPAGLKSVSRIMRRGDGKCIGGFLSWKSWLLVVGMSLFGMFLRKAAISPWIIALLLGAVGLALLMGAEIFWAALFKRLRD